ncbi:MAG TPA: HEPN domain-containing protein [bacterium]|nr:HEPN domain-containing protein [bacterium]HQN72633.1 HEPN domain-containing protein [bacterium]HQO92141.1 HEPN domain-containing protein [bacterium]
MKGKAEIIEYWKELAEYDLDTAKAMLKTKRYLYVGFMCHQVIEKIFKGYFVSRKNETPQYTHNLLKLAKAGDFYDEFSNRQKDLIDYLEPLNIEARYPSYKEALLKELTKDRIEKILNETEELYEWIKEKF